MKHTTALDTRVRQEQIRILYQLSPFVLLGIMTVMVVVAVFMWHRADHRLLLAWLALNTGLTLARLLLVNRFHHRKPQGEVMRWGVAFAVSSTLSGMLWGSIAVIFMEPTNIETVLMVTVVLPGMAAGSLVPLSAFIPACYGFTLSALLPLAFVMFSQGNEALTFIGYLVLAFVGVNLAYAIVNNRNLAESIRLRFEKNDLLDDLQRQKERAEKANTDKSRFLAATSHDLRQPLHAMDLYLGALENLLQNSEQHELLAKSRRSSAALDELLTALMDISRLDAGEVFINRSLVKLGPLLHHVWEEYREQAAQQGIELRLLLPEQDTVADTDATMLSRMLRNLLNNACSHSGASRIELRLQAQARHAQISVCDNGRGIPEAAHEQVFSEFYQLNNPERDRNKGLGLGLATVKRLAALLDHPLTLQSREGEGCCFELDLPIVNAPVDIAEPGTDAGDTDIAGLFIILVDDEKDIRSAMRSLLLQWGCELLAADSLNSLQNELDALDYPVPDLLLCDYRLRAHQTGLQVVAAVRQHFDAPIPAIIISGDTSQQIAQLIEQAGHRLLCKPVSPDSLRLAIHQQAHQH